MTWRDVFDGDKATAGTKLFDVVYTAQNAGYKFLAWDGKILFIDADGNTHYTGLLVSSLEE